MKTFSSYVQIIKQFIVVPMLIIAVMLGWYLGGGLETPSQETASVQSADAQDHAGHGTIWTCSMHPQVRQPEPGLCPICAMKLIPLVEEGSAGESEPRQLAVSDAAKALMEIETARVERRFVESDVRMVGKIVFDETSLANITAWVPGRIERMYADYTGTVVQQGDHMVDLYSPELLSAKDELRRAYENYNKLSPTMPEVLHTTAKSTLDAVRSKLRRWGMTEGQVQAAEKNGVVSDRVTIYAPIGGTVIKRSGQEGMYVETGESIYTIADLSKVWMVLEAYEADLVWLHFGQKVEFSTEAYPGRRFDGKIAFISPTLDDRTRTVSVRVNVDNSGGSLKPGMFVRATVRALVATEGRVMDPGLAGKWISPMHPEVVKDEPGICDICGMALVSAEELGYVPATAQDADKPLVIPASAPLITGKRAVVYVEVPGKDKPTYEGREVELGPRAGKFYMVKSGLIEGERVVVQGNFKIDSALEIQAKPSMMSMDVEQGVKSDIPVDPEMQSALRSILEKYYAWQDALAHDKEAEGETALDALHALLAESAQQEKIQTLVTIVNTPDKISDIERQRELFTLFSEKFIGLVKAYGMSPGDAVYRFHCPMASDWLQADEAIRNPYMGSRMFTCGTLEEILVLSASPVKEVGHINGVKGHNHE